MHFHYLLLLLQITSHITSTTTNILEIGRKMTELYLCDNIVLHEDYVCWLQITVMSGAKNILNKK